MIHFYIEHKHRIAKTLSTLLLSSLLIAPLVMSPSINSNAQHVNRARNRIVYSLNDHKGTFSKSFISYAKTHHLMITLEYNPNDTHAKSVRFLRDLDRLSYNNIPYGIFFNGSYHNMQSAKFEAINLRHQAPNAKFYINNVTQSNNRDHGQSSLEFANELRLHTNRPIILFGNLNSINKLVPQKVRNVYSSIWYTDNGYRLPDRFNMWKINNRPNSFNDQVGNSLLYNTISNHINHTTSIYVKLNNHSGHNMSAGDNQLTMAPLNYATRQAINTSNDNASVIRKISHYTKLLSRKHLNKKQRRQILHKLNYNLTTSRGFRAETSHFSHLANQINNLKHAKQKANRINSLGYLKKVSDMSNNWKQFVINSRAHAHYYGTQQEMLNNKFNSSSYNGSIFNLLQ